MARILVIEDNQANMKLARILLRNAGHEVSCAVDAESGLTTARKEQPDLILMDIQLPGIDGLEATTLLKQSPLTAAIPIIALTAMAMKEDEEKARSAGCDAYISKPLRYQDLYAAVDALLLAGSKRSEFLPGATVRTAAKVLIVDDAARDRKVLETLLQPEGYVTVSAASGAEALAEVARDAPDLILVDIMMPVMDGCELTCALKADPATANIPIIMVTAKVDRDAKLAGLTAGAEEFLTKPVNRTELWLRVRNLLRLKEFSDFQKSHNVLLEQQVQARTSELQRFRSAMDATGEAIFLVNRTTMRFVEVNATACNMLGYAREELLEVVPSQLGKGSPEQLAALYDATIAGRGKGEPSEVEIRCKDGSHLQVEVQRHAQRSGADWIIVIVVRDITERKKAQEHLKYLAHYDSLTGLPNRTLFYKSLEKMLAQDLEDGWQIGVMFIDLDHFKNVNDSLGHALGDELLVQFSNRLVECIGLRDIAGRLGGDEFALILLMRDGTQRAAVVAEQIRKALRAPFNLKGHEVAITASIGITVHPDDASHPDTLLKFADTAMYRAKLAGRDTSRFFTAQMNADVSARSALESALRKAVDNDEFVLHYQPKVQIGSGRIVGVEALLRWHRPGQGMVSPADFVPVLEETGLIARVGAWVIASAARQSSLWMRSAIGPVQIAINVSGRQFVNGELEEHVGKAIADNQIPAALLEMELTESSLMTNTESTIASLQKLKLLGVKISIDDFGTGYSSLAYLRRFNIDKLKIDIAFVREITSNADDAAIVLAIIRMAHSLNLEVIAEGVETAEQLAYLKHHQCDQFQGYFFSRPLPAREMEAMLRDNLGPPKAGGKLPVKKIMLATDGPNISR
jgi:diguanylate cyclase (GGDEF)-like protein/PAS domain S-box-containing protein